MRNERVKVYRSTQDGIPKPEILQIVHEQQNSKNRKESKATGKNVEAHHKRWEQGRNLKGGGASCGSLRWGGRGNWTRR